MAGEQEVEGRLPTRSLGGTRRGGGGGRRSRRGGRGCRAEKRLQPRRRPRPTPALGGIRRVPWAGARSSSQAQGIDGGFSCETTAAVLRLSLAEMQIDGMRKR